MSKLEHIVLASGNSGKLAEFSALLSRLGVRIVSAEDALHGSPLEIEELGNTFEENALLKARAVCRATGWVTLADDSGLEVRALGGLPGVRSARFAGERATDAENNAALLAKLEGIPERAARFRCVLALTTPWDDTPRLAVGTCNGTIACEPRGDGGFGYDPLFVVDGLGGRTMAELSALEKNRISHRAHALALLKPLLEGVLADASAEVEKAR